MSWCFRYEYKMEPFDPTQDIQKWKDHKRTDPSWEQWRIENPKETSQL